MDDALFTSDVFKAALEKCASVTRLTVQVYSAAGRMVLGPINRTPLFELFEEHDYDPGIFAECARRCVSQEEWRRKVVVTESHGLAVVGTPLLLAGEIVGAAAGGYAPRDVPETCMTQIADEAGIPVDDLRECARRQQPVPEQRFIVEGELLQVIGDALLRESHRTRLYEETAEQLQAAAVAKDEFLAMLAHELRNPLAPIRFALEMLKRQGEPATARMREVMERQVAQLVRLVDDLLDASRVTSNKIRLRVERVTLAGLMRAAVESVRPSLEAAEHHLTVSEPAGDVWLDADPTRLIQVFTNLLNNAIKFTPRGGSISFVGETTDGEAVVRVRDTGIGIPAESLLAVFNMFHQVHHSVHRSIGGLGIGLTLVKRLVEMHGGRIQVFSPGVGQGTEFVTRLPLAFPPAPDVGAAEAEAAHAPESLRVLIVDDSIDSAEMLRAFVGLIGHETFVAHDGPAALAAVEAFAPHVVFLDIGMPGMNGYDVARRLRDSGHERIYLAAVTGWGQQEDRHRAREAGFNFHLTKPVEPAVVRKILTTLQENPDAHASSTRLTSTPRTRRGDLGCLGGPT